MRETRTERAVTTMRETETLRETTAAPSHQGGGGASSSRIDEVAQAPQQGWTPLQPWAMTNRSQVSTTSTSPATTARSFGGWLNLRLNALVSDPDVFAEPNYFTIPAPTLPEPMKHLQLLAPIKGEPKE